jgi:glucose/arabinose dehydrogenase
LVNGFESSRSEPLAVSVSSLALLGDASLPAPTPSDANDSTSGPICVNRVSGECYDRRLLGSVAERVTGIAAAGDLIFIVEGESRVRVVANDVLLEEPSLTLDAGARITGVAIPPDFDRTRTVFLAWTEPLASGGETLNITRYRELLGTLGEAATIVTGLPVAAGHGAPIALDDQGLIYVALPESEPASGSSAAAWSRSILRFDSEGNVPAANPTSSPVIAHGYAMPVSLEWNSGARELWLSGNDPRWPSQVSVLRVDVDRRAAWPAVPSPVSSQAAASRVAVTPPLLAINASPALASMQQIWAVQENGVAQRILRSSGRGVLRIDGLTIDQLGDVVAISRAPANDLVLATQTRDLRSLVWRLVRQGSAR